MFAAKSTHAVQQNLSLNHLISDRECTGARQFRVFSEAVKRQLARMCLSLRKRRKGVF